MTYILQCAFVGRYNGLQLYHFTPCYHTNLFRVCGKPLRTCARRVLHCAGTRKVSSLHTSTTLFGGIRDLFVMPVKVTSSTYCKPSRPTAISKHTYPTSVRKGSSLTLYTPELVHQWSTIFWSRWQCYCWQTSCNELWFHFKFYATVWAAYPKLPHWDQVFALTADATTLLRRNAKILFTNKRTFY
jgi:hypothetical protein